MTTIAYRNGILAADTQVSSGGAIHARRTKVAKNIKGELFAYAGCASTGEAFREWFMAGRKGKCPQQRDGSGEAFIVEADGTLISYELGFGMPMEGEFFATGSGRDFALAAMAAGADAETAVAIACQFCCFSSEPIKSVEINPPLPARKPRKKRYK